MKTSNLLLTGAAILTAIAIIAQVVLAKAAVRTQTLDALSGELTTRRYDMPALRHLDFQGPIRLILTAGLPSVEIEADAELQDQLVDRNPDPAVYELRLNTSGLAWEGDHLVTARVSMPDLERVSLGGSGRVECTAPLTWRALRLELSGSPRADLAFADADELRFEGSGSVGALLRGRTRRLVIEGSGSTDVDALALAAQAVEVDLSGSGEVRVHADSTLAVEGSGSTSVEYAGRPAVSTRFSGSGGLRSVAAAATVEQ